MPRELVNHEHARGRWLSACDGVSETSWRVGDSSSSSSISSSRDG